MEKVKYKSVSKEKNLEGNNKALHIGGVIRSADSFQSEAVKRLEAFYDYGNQDGRYSNAELSRIMSCIDKIKAIPLHCV
jgi:antitoxin component YwqK of YwqJK toxin-antitoxin module